MANLQDWWRTKPDGFRYLIYSIPISIFSTLIWEWFIRPGAALLPLAMDFISIFYQGAVNESYARAVVGHEGALIYTALSMLSNITIILALNYSLSRADHRHRIVAIMQLWTFVFIMFSMVMASIGTILAANTRHAHYEYQRAMLLVSPVLSDDQRYQITRLWARVLTKEDYEKVMAKINETLTEVERSVNATLSELRAQQERLGN